MPEPRTFETTLAAVITSDYHEYVRHQLRRIEAAEQEILLDESRELTRNWLRYWRAIFEIAKDEDPVGEPG